MGIARTGKTGRDRASGSSDRNKDNKNERTQWMKSKDEKFPRHTCNGKKNKLVKG